MVATKSVKSLIDPTNSYAAVTIRTVNRSEVQIHSLETTNIISSFELDSEDRISSVLWSHPSPAQKSKKRSHGSKLSKDIHPGSSYLIVALEQGDILVFSPFQKDIVNKISNDSKIISLMSSEPNEFYGLDISGTIKQFPILESQLINSFTLASDKSLQLVKPNLNDKNTFITSSNCLYIVSPNQEESELEVALRLPVPRGHSNPINSIVQSTLNPENLITSRTDDNTIHVYSKKVNICILKAESNVTHLKLIQFGDVELLIAFLDSGNIEIFRDFDQKRSKTDELLAWKKISSASNLEDLFTSSGSIQCLWFDDVKPQFSKVDIEGSDSVVIESASIAQLSNGHQSEAEEEEGDNDNAGDDDDEEMSDASDDENDDEDKLVNEKYSASTSDQLYSLIVSALDSEDDQKLVQICNSNTSDLNIKQTLLKSVTLEQSLVIFKKLAVNISSQPSDSTNLSLWLKFLILIHGNNIIKNEDSVSVLNLLRSSLIESTKNLPNLVALQGRLQLLKSQLQLRNEMAALSVEQSDLESESDEEEYEEEEAQYQNGENTTNGSSYYINGEGDDDGLIVADEEILEQDFEEEED